MAIRLKLCFISCIIIALALELVQEADSRGGKRAGGASYRRGSKSWLSDSGRSSGISGEARNRRAGSGLSAWAIVGIILAIILGGAGLYYGYLLYFLCCADKRKCDGDDEINIVTSDVSKEECTLDKEPVSSIPEQDAMITKDTIDEPDHIKGASIPNKC